MRRSLGNGGRRSMGGGGGGGGGGMLKNFQRAVRAGGVGGATNPTSNIGGAKPEKSKNFSKKAPTSPVNTALTLSSSSPSSYAPFPSLLNLPVSAAPAPSWFSSSSTTSTEESEWECVDVNDGETAARGFYDDYLFGTVPSSDEVHHAVSALQQALGSSSRASSPEAELADLFSKDYADEVWDSRNVADEVWDSRNVSLAGSEMDWLEPSQNFYRSKMLKDRRPDTVLDAFHLLNTDSSVQRMVTSLAKDNAVWDAVMNNVDVKELRSSMNQEDGKSSKEASDGSDGGDNIFSWAVMFAKEKIMQLLDKITELMNNVFGEKKGNGFDEKVKTSFFLSIVVVLIVVLARSKTRS